MDKRPRNLLDTNPESEDEGYQLSDRKSENNPKKKQYSELFKTE